MRFFSVLLLVVASIARADELPIVALNSSAQLTLQKLQSRQISATQAKAAGLALLKSYRAKVSPTAFWKLLAKSDKVVLSFPGATLSPDYIQGPVPEMFQKRGYSFVSLAVACEYGTNRDATCDRGNWDHDIDFAVALGQLLGKKVSLYGFSMGGAVAVRGAQRYPQLIDELFLVAPALEIGVKVSVNGEDIPISELACVNGQWPYPEIVEKVKKDKKFNEHLIREACEMNRLYRENQEEAARGNSPYRGIRAKAYVIMTESDELVANEETDRFVASLGANARVYYYPKSQNVSHLTLSFLAGLRVDFDSIFSKTEQTPKIKPYSMKELEEEYEAMGLKTIPRIFWLLGES
jgi:pimeloyl-ACP methyl ester carboxylesterase